MTSKIGASKEVLFLIDYEKCVGVFFCGRPVVSGRDIFSYPGTEKILDFNLSYFFDEDDSTLYSAAASVISLITHSTETHAQD